MSKEKSYNLSFHTNRYLIRLWNVHSFVSEMEKATKLLDKKVMVAIDENEKSYHALMWVLDNLKESVTKYTLVIFAAQPFANYSSVFAAPLGFARMYFPVSAS